MKNIERKYLVDEEKQVIELFYEDIRDNYVYQNSLGEIGKIYISNFGVIIYPKIDYPEIKTEKMKEKELLKAFCGLFGTAEYNPLSGEYYRTLLSMISNGELELLGYEKQEAIELENDFKSSKPRRY